MKKQYIIILAFSAVLASCSSGNDITSNFFDDGIYFDPTYRIDSYVAEETEEFVDSNVLPDYAYSESFDYYDPNLVSASQPNQNYNGNTNIGGMGSSWLVPSFYFRMSFGSPFYNRIRYPFYNSFDYGYGYGGYSGFGYPGYGYGFGGYSGFGYPGYGYGFGGYPGYCPSNGGSGNSNDWLGNTITSDWSTNRNRTRVNGPRTGGRSSGTGNNANTGPKKTSREVPNRASANQNVVRNERASSGNVYKPSNVKARTVDAVNTGSQVSTREPIKQRQTIKTRSGNATGAVSSRSNESRVKSYYNNSKSSNTVKRRTYTSSQNSNSVNKENTRPSSVNRSNTGATRNNTSRTVNRAPAKNYYNSGTKAKPQSNTRGNTRSNVNRTVRSYNSSSGSKSTVKPPSRSSNTRPSGSSTRTKSSSPSRSSSGSSRTSGGGRR